MKALILAGGKGTRLKPTTQVYNKHLIHIYDRPMIAYAIETIKQSGITDIIISLSKDKPELFIEYLQDGTDFGVNLTYTIQNDSKGIAYAINQARHLLSSGNQGNPDKFMVYLADNYFSHDLNYEARCFESMTTDALIITKQHTDISRYGVAMMTNTNTLIRAVEKPNPKIIPEGCEIILGTYFFTDKFFEVFKNISPSKRNEYEITDILNLLVPNVLCMSYVDKWYDLGTIDDILECSNYIKSSKNNTKRLVYI